MSVNDVESVHDSGNPLQHDCQQSSQQCSHNTLQSHPNVASIASSSLFPILPADAFSRYPAVGSHAQSLSLSVDPPNKHHDPPSAANHLSSDPHEYYKQRLESSPQQHDDILTQHIDSSISFHGGMSVATYPKPVVPAQSDSTPPGAGHSTQYRSVSSTSNRAVSDGSRSLPRKPRSQQPSFKDLIEKFNKTVDEVPPVPLVSSSRATSRATSPVGSVRGPPSRASSVSQSGTRPWDRQDSSFIRRRQPSDKIEEGVLTIPKSRTYCERLASSGASLNPVSSQSLGDVHPSDKPNRRPLFGELLAVDTSVNDPGYGIPSYPRRRGSEGSIYRPYSRTLDSSLEQGTDISPSSPTAWYLGYAPSLETVRIGLDPHSHRRARSDLLSSGSKSPVTSSSSAHMAVASPKESASASFADTPHSKSRIPLSSNRLSHASDSGNSSPTRANSSTGLRSPTSPNRGALPPKGSSRLPKPSARSPTQARTAPSRLPTITSPQRQEKTRGYSRQPPQPAKNSLLQAYISAPPPKKSPPLRSSRPRQPVSEASTSSSRAKVVDRISGLQKQDDYDRNGRVPRQRARMLPELGTVDFAARRQKIQQAFNKTVEENAKREEAVELRRRARAKENEENKRKLEQKEMESSAELLLPATVYTPPQDSKPQELNVGDQQGGIGPMQEQATPAPQLTVDAAELPREQSRLDSGDSPTLGLPLNIGHGGEQGRLDAHSSNMASSAWAAPSDDTDTTNFDPEPQAGLSYADASHRTVLSQIMQMRESSPSSPTSSEDNGYTSSDRDDKESIQIMLRDSTYFAQSVDSSENQRRPRMYEDHGHMSDELRNRWSMSSWSSAHNRHSTDETVETGDECPSDMQQSIEVGLAPEELERTPQPWSFQEFPPSNIDPRGGTSHATGNPQETRNGAPAYHPQGISYRHSLARQGGWDSRRVSQLYLEELTRGKINISAPSVSKFSEDSPDLSNQAESTDRTDSLTDDAVLVSKTEGMSEPEHIEHRASLVLRDDWERASPSIADWMQIAAEDRPQVSATNDRDEGLPEADSISYPAISNRQQASAFGGPGEGLGLSIEVPSPQEGDVSAMPPPPPLPDHSPPPPPPVAQMGNIVPQPQPQQPVQPSPSIYSSHPPSSIFSSVPPEVANYYRSARNSEEAYLRYSGYASLPQTLKSADTTQATSVDTTTVEVKRGTPSPEQRRLKKRRHVIKELVDTEYSFGRDMKVVDDIYKGTSSSCLDLSAEDVKTLFSNSDQIVQFSMTFQDALKSAARSVYVMPKSQRWSSKRRSRATQTSTPSEDNLDVDVSEAEKDWLTSIGQAFVTNMSQMEKVYADYLKNHDAANKKLETLQRNPKVAIWLKECREWASDLTSAWNLDSLLVKPVQRILKYPLLLTELLNATPEDHPDRAAIMAALEGVTNISVKINEMKKRADVVGQVVSRKRKESDVRVGLSKAFGRRTEKFRQQVGLSDMFEDKTYDILAQKFSDSFFQLQVVMRDVEMYTQEVQSSMERFTDFIVAIEGYIDVAQSNYTELESKWRRFRLAVREIMAVALPDHIGTVRKSVIEPMITLLKLHDGPQRVMHKRNKRLMDYTRFKALKDRGDKPDKKTTEQGEQFVALNEALKDELPKLFALTAKLIESCLTNFVQIQATWFSLLQKKLGYLIDRFPEELNQVISDWASDFDFAEAQVLSLGICNGSLLAEAINLVNFNTPSTGPDATSPRRPSTINSSNTRSTSLNTDGSPQVTREHSGGRDSVQSPPTDGLSQRSSGSQVHLINGARNRASSSVSARVVPPAAPEMPTSQSAQALQSMSTPSAASTRPGTSSGQAGEPFPSLPRLSLETPFLHDLLTNPPENNEAAAAVDPSSPGGRYSGFFSSAMPMSDSPRQDNPTDPGQARDPKVLFLAASIYEFNIDRARREAGYPYLTYVAGEIFDVIAEKGELWLARNQDDPTHQVGWIWNKHFAKLAA
ncbi:hypothetical protein DTO282E5_9125 [Paecilomyces variotii]|nr:hypothetical protein DTO282E5_9125 [Paecilomyces variotii]